MAIMFRALCLFIMVFLPAAAFGGEMVKLQHTLSLYLDDKGEGFRRPEGIACNEKSLCIVADAGNNRLLPFTLQEKSVKLGAEVRLPQLSNPLCVQINSKGEIFALDGKLRRIVWLSPEGGFKGYLAAEGLPSPSSFVPRSLKIGRDDELYVLDVFAERVIVMDSQGKYRRQIVFPKEYGFFSDLALDAKGAVLIIDSVRARVWSAPPNANSFAPLTDSLKSQVDFPVGIAVDKRGTIYVTDSNGGAIGMLSSDGAFLGTQGGKGWNEGLFSYPTQLCVSEKGEVVVADRGNNRIQIFSPVK